MTVIYVDTLFLLNALVDYLLLLAAARLAGEPLRRVRFLLAAVLGGIYAVALFLPGFGFLAHPFCRAASCILMLLLAYGDSHRLLRQAVIFLALTCAFGGGILAIGFMGGRGLSTAGGGVLVSALDLRTVLLSSALCYGILSLALPRIARHSRASGEILPISFEVEGRRITLAALVDTGNTLTDPMTGRGVPVAEGERLRDLFPGKYRPENRDLLDPAGAMERLDGWNGRLRLLPYRSVGVECGLLLTVRMDHVVLDGTDLGPVPVALSPGPVSDGGGYAVLIGDETLRRRRRKKETERGMEHEQHGGPPDVSGGTAEPPGPDSARQGDVHRGERHPAGAAQPGGGGRTD